MNIWEKGGYVFIRINSNFVYDINISKLKEIGDVNDNPGVLSMWGRINHLRDKNWWSPRLEKSFISFCEKIIKG